MVCEGNAVSPVDAQRTVACKYARAGQIVARTANGISQTYEYDKKGQLLAVKDADGNAVERYAYDKAGNMLKKTVGGKTTTFTFDAANQLVSSTTDGVTTRYAYDAAGRLVKEGSKTYTYGYLDKVMSVTEEDKTYTYTYHADGQLASANYGGKTEGFLWDGLALIQRGDEGGRVILDPFDRSHNGGKRMRHRLMLISVIILCAIVSHAIGISNVVALDNRVRSDLKLDDNDIWEFKADSNRIESILVGLRSITNGMHKMTVATLMGEPDHKVRAPDKSVASMHGTSQYDYNFKKKKLNGANVNDWMLSIMFTKDETLNYILYQRDGQVEKIDITN